MIDRNARDRMVGAIKAYMSEQTTAFEFDESLFEIATETKDETVSTARRLLWGLYDDVKDHKIVAVKEEWDYLNRILLLLQSDGEFETTKRWKKWQWRNAVAALSLIGFAAVAIRTGWGQHLFVFAMPFGLISMSLAWAMAREHKKMSSALEMAITPFPSVRSLFSVRRRVKDFRKTVYPKAISGRRIRDPFIEKTMWIPRFTMWLMFSPIVLLIQTLPARDIQTRIRMPQ